MKRILILHRSGIAIYKKSNAPWKKLREFAGGPTEQTSKTKFSVRRFYWATGVTGDAWYRGGFYAHPFIHKPAQTFYDRYTDEVYTLVDNISKDNIDRVSGAPQINWE